jgi:hypothetical protein
MRRRLLIALFALGTLGGYGSAIAGSSCRAHHRQAAWERHFAHLCASAARAPAGAAAADDAADDDPSYRPW